MTERSDITITWGTNPRNVAVDAPSVALVHQDLVDTLRAREADLDNLDKDSLLDADGKTAGVVGITTILQACTLSFETRVIIAESGTVTTANTPGVRLIDSTALFVTNGVLPGYIVDNTQAGAHASVLEVISETELRCTPLAGGTRQTFLFGDTYQIFQTVACKVQSGNLFAVDDVEADAEAILASFGTDVTVEQSSSPTIPPVTATGVLDGSITWEQAMRLILAAAAAGNVSGAPTGPILIKDAATGLKTRITASVDGVGNRTITIGDVT